ncbi:MAG: KH domain-containing protein [Deltaproteobacteria bacterium]|nr:KH domain-containing protein [Deltaproteobacteria bacterium]
MKDLIKYIAQAMVDYPEAVEVFEVEGEHTSVIELKVAKDDMGKIIGKQGRNAHAIRTILSAASAKIKQRSVLEIIEQGAMGEDPREESNLIDKG